MKPEEREKLEAELGREVLKKAAADKQFRAANDRCIEIGRILSEGATDDVKAER